VGLRSKSWGGFTRAGAPRVGPVFTACDGDGGERCPIWPGQPLAAHRDVPDSPAANGTDEQARRAFVLAFERLQQSFRSPRACDSSRSPAWPGSAHPTALARRAYEQPALRIALHQAQLGRAMRKLPG